MELDEGVIFNPIVQTKRMICHRSYLIPIYTLSFVTNGLQVGPDYQLFV